MSYSRRCLPDQIHTISHRTVDRAYFLTPTPDMAALCAYVFLLICSRNRDSVDAYAACFLSNHPHFSLRDRLGGADSRLEDFNRDLFSLLARGVNATLGRGGKLWCGKPFHNVEVHGRAAFDEQLLYIWTQALEAGLVERVEDWPGFMILPEDIGRTITVRRPDCAFFGANRPSGPSELAQARAALAAERGELPRRERAPTGAERRGEEPRPSARPATSGSTLPEFVSYTVPVPPGFASAEEARVYYRRLLDQRQAEIRARRAKAGLGYLGVAAVLRQDPLYRPGEDRPDFSRVPRISCLEGAELYLTLVVGLAWWHRAHREGVEVLLRTSTPWRARFPEGTKRRAQELARLQSAKRAPP